MFEKIIVATDLSPSSDQLMRQIDGVKSLGAREVLLVRCFNLRDVGALGESLLKEAEVAIAEQSRILRGHGFRVESEVVAGLAQVEINRLAEERDCSLIVVGERKHSLLGELLFDEMAGAIAHSARKPVLVMRLHGKRETEGEGEDDSFVERDLLRHVLVPTDFSHNAEHAFGCVEGLAGQGIRKATIVHIQSTLYLQDVELDRETLDQFAANDRQRLRELRKRLLKTSVPEVETELRFGVSPKNEILQRIEADDISLVAVGSQGHGYLGELLLGGVGYAVARHSPVPTLLLPMDS